MDILRCLFLTIQDKTLIVPYSSVAEVIPYEKVGSVTKISDAVQEVSWRDLKIPVLSLERIDHPQFEYANPLSTRIAILNRCSDAASADFIGLFVQGLPSMNRIKRGDLQSVGPSETPYFSMEITIRGKQAFIPNLAWIEETVAHAKRPQS